MWQKHESHILSDYMRVYVTYMRVYVTKAQVKHKYMRVYMRVYILFCHRHIWEYMWQKHKSSTSIWEYIWEYIYSFVTDIYESICDKSASRLTYTLICIRHIFSSWLPKTWLLGSIKSYVSFAKDPYTKDYILQSHVTYILDLTAKTSASPVVIMFHDSFTYVPWLIHKCAMTHNHDRRGAYRFILQSFCWVSCDLFNFLLSFLTFCGPIFTTGEALWSCMQKKVTSSEHFVEFLVICLT